MKKRNDVPQAGETTSMSPGRSAPRRKSLRRLAWVVAALAVICPAVWAAWKPITAKMEAELIRQLNEHGVYPRYAHRLWLPWRGFRFDRVVLHRDARENEPVIELSSLTVRLPWAEIWKHRDVISRWQTVDATLTLHDAAGSIAFDHITADIVLRGHQLEILKLKFRHHPLSCSVTGGITLRTSAQQNPARAGEPRPSPPRDFAVNLRIVRAVLSWLDFKPDAGPFHIHGTVFMDFRAAPKWQADLKATGQAVVWKGIPLRAATAVGKFSQAGMQINPDVQLTKGFAKVAISREGWRSSPLLVAGEFADGEGHGDIFSASYNPPSRTFVVAALHGAANVPEFALNFPNLVLHLPPEIQIRTFPEIAAKDIRWSARDPSGTWSVASLRFKTPADVAITLGGRPLAIDGVKGQASSSDGLWRIQGMSGRLSWGDWSARNGKVECELSASEVKFESRFGFAKGSIDLAGSTKTRQPAAWIFTGSVADAAGLVDRFSGQYDARTRALSLAQLAGKANLVEIASNFRGVAARLPLGLQIRAFPDLAVEDFSHRTGSARWSVGSLQLRSPADITLAVNGRPLAIDQLIGLGAFDGKMWRLSKVSGQSLGGRFSLDGVYEGDTFRDATIAVTKVRLKELSPWTDAPPASLGNALLSVNYRGALGAKPGQLSGAGNLRMVDAPIVKVPLLDQTYALFSIVRLGIKRAGTGSLESTFAVKDGVFTISKFAARSDAVDVTATGTIDLVQRQISAQAQGQLRGIAGLSTSLVTSMLSLKVSGPIGQVRVQPESPVRGVIKGGAKLPLDVIKAGVTMPLKLLDLFKTNPPEQP
jgi:hypothetical protein